MRRGAIRHTAMAALTCLCGVLATSCGQDAKSTVSAEVVSSGKMPFHGPNGPGTEPIAITFNWTVVVEAHHGLGCTVDRITTVVSEAESGKSLMAETDPGASGALASGERAEFPQSQGGSFHSSLYQRPWSGLTRVDVTYSDGRTERLEVAFAIP